MHARQKSHHQLLVEEFMLKAQQEVLFRPTMPSLEVRRLRANLIIEEALETIRALGFIISVDIQNARDCSDRKQHVWHLYEHGKPDLEQITDGCCDLKVVTTGTLSACGIADAQPQELVDQSNLAKFEAPRCPDCNSTLVLKDHQEWWCSNEHCHKGLFEKTVGPYRREDGKWIKPPYWKAPDLATALKEQVIATLRKGWYFDKRDPSGPCSVGR